LLAKPEFTGYSKCLSECVLTCRAKVNWSVVAGKRTCLPSTWFPTNKYYPNI
jgi:hypothetical protein